MILYANFKGNLGPKYFKIDMILRVYFRANVTLTLLNIVHAFPYHPLPTKKKFCVGIILVANFHRD